MNNPTEKTSNEVNKREVFNKKETDHLIELIYNSPQRNELEDRGHSKRHVRENAWKAIHSEFTNTNTAGNWTVKQLQTKFDNIKKRYRRQRNKFFEEHNRTGGGTLPDEDQLPSWWDHRVEEICGYKADPLENDNDCDSEHHLSTAPVLGKRRGSRNDEQTVGQSSQSSSQSSTAGSCNKKTKESAETKRQRIMDKLEYLIDLQVKYSESINANLLNSQNVAESEQPASLLDHQYQLPAPPRQIN